MHEASLASWNPRESPSTRRLLVVDDHRTFAEALACRLDAEPDMVAVAATTVDDARSVLTERMVDVVLLDVDLGGDDGILFAGEALARNPGIRIVVVTSSEGERRITEAVQAGVCGWVPKEQPVEHLLAVVRGAMRGETWIPPRLLTGVLAELMSARRDRAEHETLLTTLTRREKEILYCLAAGMSRDAIAGQLYLSRNTVRTHIQNLLGKLGVHSTLAAVALARRSGLTTAPNGRG